MERRSYSITFGTRVQAILYLRRHGLVGVAAVRFGGQVLAQAQGDIVHVGGQRVAQGRHAIGIDGLHLFCQCKNLVQLGQRRGGLVVGHFELGQVGDAFYVGECQGHGEWRGVPRISIKLAF